MEDQTQLQFLNDISAEIEDLEFISQPSEKDEKSKKIFLGKENEILSAAAKHGREKIVQLLITHCQSTKFKNSAVDDAWKNRHFRIVLLLLKSDFPFPNDFKTQTLRNDIEDEKNLKNFADERDFLHDLILNNELDKVQKLIYGKQSKFFLNSENTSAASVALKNKKFQIYAFLKSIGAEFRKKDEKSRIEGMDLKDKIALKEAQIQYFQGISKAHLFYLLSKSRCKKYFEGLREILYDFYEKVDSVPEISTMLKVVQFSDYLDIVFDFEEENVAELNPMARKNIKGETLYKEGRLYIAAKDIRGEEKILGTIAHELTHMAMEIIYKNECNPYSKHEKTVKNDFDCIKEELEKNLRKSEDEIAKNLMEAVENYDDSDHHCELIVKIPQILIQFQDGRDWLEKFSPDLFRFYREKVLSDCENYIKESSLLKVKNIIQSLNETIGNIGKIKSCNLTFKNVDAVKDFINQNCNFFFYKTENILLGTVKILQACFGEDYINSHDFLLLKFENITSLQKILEVAITDACHFLIIQFGGYCEESKLAYCFEKISLLIRHKSNKKIIIVTKSTENIYKILKNEELKSEEKIEECTTLYDLSENCKLKILRKEIFFEGVKTNLSGLIGVDEALTRLIKGDIIENLLEKKEVYVGDRNNNFLNGAFAYIYEQIDRDRLIEEIKTTENIFLFKGIQPPKTGKFLDFFGQFLEENLLEIEEINFENYEISKKLILVHEEFSNDDFKKFCQCNSDKKICFIDVNNIEANPTFTLLEFHNPNFYLQRKFNKVAFNSKKILDFLQIHSDYFVITNGEKLKLPKLLNLKFLNYEKSKDFFERNSNYLRNLHWLIVKNDKIYWKDSTATPEATKKFLERENSYFEKIEIEEGDLINELGKILIIADDPGMGKSTTLTKLYENKSILKNHWPIRINLKENIKEIKKFHTENLKIPRVVDFLTKVKPKLKNDLAKNLLEYSLKPGKKSFKTLLLAFDGFDEILDHRERNKIIKIFKFLKNETHCKIWITTRLHYRKKLEHELSTFSVEFIPIDNDSKRIFIKNHLENRLKLVFDDNPQNFTLETGSKMCNYTEKFLEKIHYFFKGDVSRFIGTPLQLNLMTANSTEHFKNYIKTGNLDFTYLGTNLLEVYEKFIDKKYSEYFKKQKVHEMLMQNLLRKKFDKVHKKLAESLIRNLKYEELTEYEPLILLVGLIQSDNTSIEFVHFTFREYFSASVFVEYFTKQTYKKRDYILKINFLLTEILVNPAYTFVRNFMNLFLDKIKLEEIPEKNCRKIRELFTSVKPKRLWYQPWEFTYKVRTILFTAMQESNLNIFNLLIYCCRKKINDLSFSDIMQMVNGENETLIHLAISQNYFQTLKEMFLILEKLPKGKQRQIFKMKDDLSRNIIYAAIENGNPEIFQLLLNRAEKIFSQRQQRNLLVRKDKLDKETYLHKASALGHYEIVKILLEKAEKLLFKEELIKLLTKKTKIGGCNSLHLSAFHNHYEIVQILLKKSHKMMPKSKFGEFITDPTDTHNFTALHLSAISGDFDILKFILKLSGKILTKIELFKFLMAVTNIGRTVLYISAAGNHSDLVKILLKTIKKNFNNSNSTQLAFLTAADKSDNRTAIEKAAELGHTQIFAMLLSEEERLSPFTVKSMSASLHFSVDNGHADIVKILLKRENLNFLTYAYGNGRTVLHKAAYFGRYTILQDLLSPGLLPIEDQRKFLMAQSQDGSTALHVSAHIGHTQIVKLFIEKSGEIFSNNDRKKFLTMKDINSGATALHKASRFGHVEIVQILLEEGEKILSKSEQSNFLLCKDDYYGATALHQSASKGHSQVVEILLEKARDVFGTKKQIRDFIIMRANQGKKNAVELSVDRNHPEVSNLLLNEISEFYYEK